MPNTPPLKAYLVFIRGDEHNCAYIAAPTAGQARYRALRDAAPCRRLTDLAARRAPAMDDLATQPGPITSAERLDSYDCECWGIPVRLP